ncbi:hypothetical protein [Vibrio crassostreae]|uniref:hypothetical protein n=1 Tax=Vibrio crassostreae TaxID=246167 RepID=UPI001B30C900|nr:hypothetical protein [Vibrio crassostreae]
MRYIVRKEYSDAPKSAIKLAVGEELQFIEESNPDGDWPNWIFCKGADKEGWVPKQILQIEGSKVICLKDYNATEHNLQIGETLSADESLNGWIYGIKEGFPETIGWAPLNCLEKL